MTPRAGLDEDDGYVTAILPERYNGRSNETDTLWPYGIFPSCISKHSFNLTAQSRQP